jgi:hypothetical protein
VLHQATARGGEWLLEDLQVPALGYLEPRDDQHLRGDQPLLSRHAGGRRTSMARVAPRTRSRRSTAPRPARHTTSRIGASVSAGCSRSSAASVGSARTMAIASVPSGQPAMPARQSCRSILRDSARPRRCGGDAGRALARAALRRPSAVRTLIGSSSPDHACKTRNTFGTTVGSHTSL